MICILLKVFIWHHFLIARVKKREMQILAWHDNLRKRKKTGGKKKAYRTKRAFEQGRQPIETAFDDPKRKNVKGRSGIIKTKISATNMVNVSDPRTGRTEHLEIIDVVSNPANADYNRRGVITKGTIVRTENGLAKIISRPGQVGSLSAVVVEE